MASASLDSDDDSLLDMGPTLSTRRKKAADRSHSNAMTYLDDAVEYSGRRQELQQRMVKIKQEEPEEEFLIKAETLANEAASFSGAKRRRETSDEINGVEEDEEDGIDYKRRVALAAANDTGRTTLLGVRKTLGAPKKEDGLWHSEKEAVQELKAFLKRMETEHRSNKSLRLSVIQPLNAAVRTDALALFLCNSSLAKLCAKHNLKEMPQDMIVWLYQVACSGGTGNLPLALSIGAFDTLMALLKDNIATEKPIMALSGMVPQLQEWFGLCWDSNITESGDGNDAIAKVHEKAQGLCHFLHLWAMFLACDSILSDSHAKHTTNMADTATQSLVALAMAGLDVAFQSGRRLLESLQHVMHAVVAHVAMKLLLDKEELAQWMDVTADRILERCPTLGPGTPKAEDADDPQAWLCLSLVVRLCPIQAPNGLPHHKECAEFKARIAIRSLQKCVDIEDWDQQVKNVLLENDNAPMEERYAQSLRWRTLVSAYVGLITIGRLGNEMAMDGPRCLSTVENAFHCVQAGTYLFSSDLPSEDGSGGLYGSQEQADEMFHVLDLMENECIQLNKRMRTMSSRPHFRRVEYHLACLRAYYRHCKEEAGYMAGHRAKSSMVQKSLSDWFTNHDESDDESPLAVSQSQ